MIEQPAKNPRLLNGVNGASDGKMRGVCQEMPHTVATDKHPALALLHRFAGLLLTVSCFADDETNRDTDTIVRTHHSFHHLGYQATPSSLGRYSVLSENL